MPHMFDILYFKWQMTIIFYVFYSDLNMVESLAFKISNVIALQSPHCFIHLPTKLKTILLNMFFKKGRILKDYLRICLINNIYSAEGDSVIQNMQPQYYIKQAPERSKKRKRHGHFDGIL